MPRFRKISKRYSDVDRAAPAGPMFGSSVLGGPLYTDAYGARRAPTPTRLVEAYKSLIYACVQINEHAVCRVPLRLYSRSSKGDRPKDVAGPRSIRRSQFEHLRGLGYLRGIGPTADNVQEITNHPALDSLDLPDPDGYFDRQQLIGLLVRYCDVVGIGYLLLDNKGRPGEYLWPLASQYMIPIPMPDSPLIEGYWYFGRQYNLNEVLRFRTTPSLRDPYKAGFSPTYAAIEYAQLEDEWVSIQSSLLSAGPLPKLAFLPKDATMVPGPEEQRRFRQSLDLTLSRGNAGKPLIGDGAYEPHVLSYTPSDLGGIQITQDVREMVANVFGIPQPYLSGDTNLANLQAADTQHARNAVEPRCKAIAAVLTRYVQRFDPRLFFAFDSAIAEDELKDAQVTDLMLKSGRVTINQANEETPWPPVPWGDEPWMPGTLVQPSMAAERHQAGLEQQKAANERADKELDLAYSGEPDDSDGARSLDGADGPADAAVAPGPLEQWLEKIERALGIEA